MNSIVGCAGNCFSFIHPISSNTEASKQKESILNEVFMILNLSKHKINDYFWKNNEVNNGIYSYLLLSNWNLILKIFLKLPQINNFTNWLYQYLSYHINHLSYLQNLFLLLYNHLNLF